MIFRDAVEQTDSIADCYRPGLQALREADRNRIECSETRRLAGSVDLDAALRPSHPNDPVWDYGIGWNENADADSVIWLEVHPANAGHVDEVLSKLEWLRTWLSETAPLCRRMPGMFVWVASGAVALPQNSPQRKKIAARGLHFAGQRLKLPLETAAGS